MKRLLLLITICISSVSFGQVPSMFQQIVLLDGGDLMETPMMNLEMKIMGQLRMQH